MLNREIRNSIKSHALLNKPKECCGVIVQTPEDFLVFPCKNISEYPEDTFVLNYFDYLRASKLGKIIALYHSQKDEEPSELDKKNSLGHNIYSIIYSWKANDFYFINPQGCHSQYLGIPFVLGKTDCFSLVRKYYLNELNVHIFDYFRDDDLLDKNPNIILQHYEKEGFGKVSFDEIKKHDVLIFGLKNEMPHHFGIYLGNNTFLHHPRNKKSTVEFLTDFWKSKTVLIARHKNLW